MTLGALLVAIAGGLSAQEGSRETCRLKFEREPSSGYFVAAVSAEQCRNELMARDLRGVSATHKVGRVFMGSVDLSSSSLDAQTSASGDRIRRWHINLPAPFEEFQRQCPHSSLESCPAKHALHCESRSATSNETHSI